MLDPFAFWGQELHKLLRGPCQPVKVGRVGCGGGRTVHIDGHVPLLRHCRGWPRDRRDWPVGRSALRCDVRGLVW